MVEHDLAKVDTGVQFPSPAPVASKPDYRVFCFTLRQTEIRLLIFPKQSISARRFIRLQKDITEKSLLANTRRSPVLSVILNNASDTLLEFGGIDKVNTLKL